MGLPLRKPTIEDFLAWEEHQAERHEYWRGDIFAMVGAAARHNRVVLNLASRISDHLDGTGCSVFAETMKLRLADHGILYPDVMVTCSLGQSGDEKLITDPKLIIEVLSPSTGGYDRRDKFVLYRALPSLREYVLIEPEKREVEVFTLAGTDHWMLADQTRSRSLTLSTLDLVLSFDAVFKGTASTEPRELPTR